MNFFEWKNRISKHFFNPDHAGRDIHLFITKQEIINLGKDDFIDAAENEIWADFLTKIKNGLPGSQDYSDIFEKGLHSFAQWKKPGIKSIAGYELKYPPYISYLVFSVLPLIEIQGDYNSNNYFDRLEDFLKENNIIQNLRGRLKLIDSLWDDLSDWSINTKNGELGLFKVSVFKNSIWKFVGKPFSQCVLPPKAIRKLPDLFYSAGWVPKTFYSDEAFKNILILYGVSILSLKPSVIEIIKKWPKDDLALSIIETVKTEFNEWLGEKHEIALKDGTEKKIRTNTVVPLKLQFKINEDGEIGFSFRVNYISEPPPELKLDEFEDIYENEKWSRTLKRAYKDSFELRDPRNKWIAKFESKSIRLFIRGGYFQLGNDFWIEVESLSRVEGMYLMCKQDINDSIENWIKQNCAEFRDESSLANIPLGYSLFWFRNPRASHEKFQQLRVFKDKKISIRTGTGLRIINQTFLNAMLPEIEVTNAEGKESLYLQYENSNEKIFLEKNTNLGGVWILPPNLLLNSSFFIQIENEFIEGNRRSYKIESPSLKLLRNEHLPRRNKFSAVSEHESDFIQGNKIQYQGTLNTFVDEKSFSSNIKATIQKKPGLTFKDNYLLKWLVGVQDCFIDAYNEVFEIILHNLFEGEQLRVQERRISSINILDYLGYVEYDYDKRKIYTLPPKLISIPSKRGQKALLIGGRDENLVNEMIAYCDRSNNSICLSVKRQSEKNILMLIPDAIIFESNNSKEFENVANHFQIEYDKWYLLKLKNFLPSIKNYEEFIKAMGSLDSWEKFGLEKKVFSKETLKFEFADGFDRNLSLTECRPSYVPEFGLWINQSYFKVDKNWGKYLFINHSSEHVRGYDYGNVFSKPIEIFRNGVNLAIPASLPLPKLFSRLIMQLSGEAPDFKQLNLKGRNVWYNIYRDIPSTFIDNLFKFKLNMIIETTNQEL
ncbi:MAG: hypothetical protein ABI723_22490 [Bacteroidia bacterium]